MLAKPVWIASYKEMRIDFIRNDISIKKLGEEFEMGVGACAEFSKVTILTRSLWMPSLSASALIGKSLPRHAAQAGLCLEAQAQDSTSAIILLGRDMLDPQKKIEREALLRRLREIHTEFADQLWHVTAFT